MMRLSGGSYQQWNDGQLLEEFARAGTAAAFEVVVRRHGGAVLAVCRRVLGDGHLAEDATQAVLLTMAQKAGSLREHVSVIGWLQKVAWHVALRAREAGAIRRTHEQKAAAMQAANMNNSSADANSQWDELRPLLDEELAALPERYRLPLMLHYLEGHTMEESAKLLNLRLWTVAGQIRHGRELLRGRLARRGVTLPALALAGLLAGQAAQAAPAALVASTVQAATLLAAGHTAVGSVISLETMALMKGTIRMLILAKLKVATAVAAAACLSIVLGVGVYQLALAQVFPPMPPRPVATEKPKPTVEVARPAIVVGPVVDWAKVQTDALARQVTVSYQRATLAEILSDLEDRTHVRVLYPKTLGRWPNLDIDGRNITVREVLQKVITAGKFDGDWRPEYLVLSQKADDAALAALEKQLAPGDRWQRLQAIWDLSELADPRIYPMLGKMLADKDIGIREWALRGLEKHARMSPIMGDAEKDAIAKATLTWLNGESAKQMEDPWHPTISPDERWYQIRMRDNPEVTKHQDDRMLLMAGTGRPDVLAALIAVIKKANFEPCRPAAATALGDVRLDEADLVAAFPTVEAEYRGLDEAINVPMKKWHDGIRAGHDPGPPNLPQEYYTWQGWSTATRRAVLWSLVKLHNPSVIPYLVADYKARQDEFLDTPDDRAMLVYSGDQNALRLAVQSQSQQLWTKTPGLVDWTKKITGGGSMTPEQMQQQKMMESAQALGEVRDASASAELVKLAQDPQRMEIVCSLMDSQKMNAQFTIVDDPALVDALLKWIKDDGAAGVVAMRSLAAIHDVKVIDALIEQTKSADEQHAVNAATALARTHDPRALSVIMGMITGRPLPDWEKVDKAAMDAAQKEAATQPVDWNAVMNGTAKIPDIAFYKPHRVRINPAKILVRALPQTRDPKLIDALLQLATAKTDDDQSKDIADIAWRLLQWCASSPADVDKLLAIMQKATVEQQLKVIMGEIRSNAPHGTEYPAWWAADVRWVAFMPALAVDKAALDYGLGGQPRMRHNSMVDALDAIMAPSTEKVMSQLCKDPHEQTVANWARLAIEYYNDEGEQGP